MGNQGPVALAGAITPVPAERETGDHPLRIAQGRGFANAMTDWGLCPSGLYIAPRVFANVSFGRMRVVQP